MSGDPLYATADLCLDLAGSQTKDSLTAHLETSAKAFGASFFCLGIRGAFPTTRKPAELRLENFPAGFKTFFDEAECMKFDPVLRHAITKYAPFRWETIPHVGEAEQRLASERVKYGMQHGFSCASLGQYGFLGLVNFCGAKRIDDALWPRISVASELLCMCLLKAGLALLESDVQQAKLREELSPVEIEVLELTAQGLTAEEVGERLKMTKHGVRFHLDQATQKLGVKNRREVVTEAMHLGIIRKRHFEPPKFSGADD